MSLDELAIQRALSSHAGALGIFERVQRFDPTNAPGSGMTCALLATDLGTEPSTGLNITAGLVVWVMRIMLPMQTKPLDEVDPTVLGAGRKLIARLLADLKLGGLVRTIDVRGMTGTRLRMRLAYLTIDKTLYRLGDLTVPVIVNDVWPEVQ